MVRTTLDAQFVQAAVTMEPHRLTEEARLCCGLAHFSAGDADGSTDGSEYGSGEHPSSIASSSSGRQVLGSEVPGHTILPPTMRKGARGNGRSGFQRHLRKASGAYGSARILTEPALPVLDDIDMGVGRIVQGNSAVLTESALPVWNDVLHPSDSESDEECPDVALSPVACSKRCGRQFLKPLPVAESCSAIAAVNSRLYGSVGGDVHGMYSLNDQARDRDSKVFLKEPTEAAKLVFRSNSSSPARPRRLAALPSHLVPESSQGAAAFLPEITSKHTLPRDRNDRLPEAPCAKLGDVPLSPTNSPQQCQTRSSTPRRPGGSMSISPLLSKRVLEAVRVNSDDVELSESALPTQVPTPSGTPNKPTECKSVSQPMCGSDSQKTSNAFDPSARSCSGRRAPPVVAARNARDRSSRSDALSVRGA